MKEKWPRAGIVESNFSCGQKSKRRCMLGVFFLSSLSCLTLRRAGISSAPRKTIKERKRWRDDCLWQLICKTDWLQFYSHKYNISLAPRHFYFHNPHLERGLRRQEKALGVRGSQGCQYRRRRTRISERGSVGGGQKSCGVRPFGADSWSVPWEKNERKTHSEKLPSL